MHIAKKRKENEEKMPHSVWQKRTRSCLFLCSSMFEQKAIIIKVGQNRGKNGSSPTLEEARKHTFCWYYSILFFRIRISSFGMVKIEEKVS